MNLRTIEIGDEHADLWEGLTIENRHIDGPVDVTTGTHEVFGLAIVSHYGLGSIVEWWTTRPIRDSELD